MCMLFDKWAAWDSHALMIWGRYCSRWLSSRISWITLPCLPCPTKEASAMPLLWPWLTRQIFIFLDAIIIIFLTPLSSTSSSSSSYFRPLLRTKERKLIDISFLFFSLGMFHIMILMEGLVYLLEILFLFLLFFSSLTEELYFSMNKLDFVLWWIRVFSFDVSDNKQCGTCLWSYLEFWVLMGSEGEVSEMFNRV